LVWPTVRVDEAWYEGLDAIAITDHLEYQPHKDDLRLNYNRSWQIAKEYGDKKGVIVIPGTEITKNMPPGHFNAIFIKDATPIMNEDFKLAISEAVGQGAFIMWNHPGWKAQQPDTMRWWDEHTFLYDQGWLHGIEVANEFEFYPEAVDWARSKNLTMLANSDQHGPFQNAIIEKHRTCTFVFATEKSQGGIREALFNGRTLAFIGDKLIGNPSLLKAFFLASVNYKKKSSTFGKYALVNQSDLKYKIYLYDRVYKDWEIEIDLKGSYESYFKIPERIKMEDIEVKVINLISGSEDVLKLPLSELEIIH
jgi:hypothetical protein